ncbi:OmpA family protein [Sphaerotilus sp.]|uniref:OmpA family protein n=1 Tax=Sphaerotilus sp. TaxID=2093942 RepID=UPI002ACE4397|nr:OmpA family protein [Sphaerotilus sp.]MDZ7855309.1 OmpA family protein [Sphaerotilus sp.]
MAIVSVAALPVAVAAQAPAPAPVMTSVAERAPVTAVAGSVRKPTVLALTFASDSATLTPSHKAQLASLLPAISHSERVLILGRTDDVGTGGANEAIALARATAVRDHLRRIARTLPQDIRIDARGLCCYAAPNNTPEGRAQNRRVEVVLTSPNEVRP